MPPPYGLNSTGFNRKTSGEVLEDIAASQVAEISPLWDGKGLSGAGTINQIFASELGAVWEALESVAKQFDPRDAEGEALESVCAITGTRRQPARRTVVACECDMTGGTTVAAGQMIATVSGDPTRRFRNSFAFVVVGSGTVTQPVQFESENTGPILAPANLLTVRATAVSGWLTVNNPADGITGAEVEKDEALKLRRELELAQVGAATVPALTAALSALAGVTSVSVLNNDTDTTDANSVPPHSIEAVVRGGDSATIARTILSEKAAGDGTAPGAPGVVTQTITLADGIPRVVSFTRPSEISIYLAFFIQVTSDYPGDAALIALIVEWANSTFAPGTDVVPSRLKAKAFEVPGIWNVPFCYADTSSGPSSEPVIGMSVRQLARFDASRVTVTVL